MSEYFNPRPIIDPCMGTAAFLPAIIQSESLTSEQMVSVLMAEIAAQRQIITEQTSQIEAQADTIEELTKERDLLQVRLDQILRKISELRGI